VVGINKDSANTTATSTATSENKESNSEEKTQKKLTKLYDEFYDWENKGYIGWLVAEFELKKSANFDSILKKSQHWTNLPTFTETSDKMFTGNCRSYVNFIHLHFAA